MRHDERSVCLADKEGFLRSETSLIQTIGRAARNAQGRVLLYADKITPAMRRSRMISIRSIAPMSECI